MNSNIDDEIRETRKIDFTTAFVKIMDEKKYVGIRPHSHNIISLTLLSISEKHGQEEANKLITMCKLNELGWRESKST